DVITRSPISKEAPPESEPAIRISARPVSAVRSSAIEVDTTSRVQSSSGSSPSPPPSTSPPPPPASGLPPPPPPSSSPPHAAARERIANRDMVRGNVFFMVAAQYRSRFCDQWV